MADTDIGTAERLAGSAPAASEGVAMRAAIEGPIRAAANGQWGVFGFAAVAELAGLVLLLQGLIAPDAARALGGLALIALARLGVGLAARWQRSRQGRARVQPGGSRTRMIAGGAIMAFCYVLTLARFVPAEPFQALLGFPAPSGLDTATARAIDVGVDWMKRSWVDFFDALTAGLRACLAVIETAFVRTPWPVVTLIAMLAALRLSGWKSMVFTGACLAYLGLFGFWEKGMATMALVATSVLICVVVGLPVGILCAKSRRANAVIEPILDVMQTLPTFVYLIPAVAFFSIGKPPGVIATVIFSLPPMVRLTALGIRQVAPDVREAADAFGATPAQMLFKVELPLAVPSIRLGVNQTIMMCLSMVVVAAMIGAGGLGLDVIRSLQHLKTGQGFLAGIAIVLCAMALDRMVRGRARRSGAEGG